MPSLGRSLCGIIVCVTLAGCSLPRGAALESEVLRAAGSKDADFAVVDIERETLDRVAAWPATGGFPARTWPKKSAGEPGQIVAVGDIVEITVWDSDQNSLLAPPEQKSSKLQTMRVSSTGAVFIPYVGPVRVAGMSPEHARETVQEKLTALIPSAQIQFDVIPGPANAVSVVGGVRNPSTVPLVSRDLSVLDLVSMAGGVSERLENPQVRLVRGDAYYAISLQRLYDEPALDPVVKGGDKVFVEEDKRYFLSLGATGVENQIPFNRENVSALDAITLAQGLKDARANPKGILILRQYDPADVARLGAAGPEKSRVVFTLDLTSADGLFSAGKFSIMPGDLVLGTESAAGSASTIIGLLGASTRIAVDAEKL